MYIFLIFLWAGGVLTLLWTITDNQQREDVNNKTRHKELMEVLKKLNK